ncbi:MAG TPA: HtaA domain-containing protein, partial [Sandaracinaceae bacterium]
ALFRFPDGAGTADPEAGTLDLRFAGGLRFTGTDLDLALDGVTVSVADGTGTLSADVTAEGATRRTVYLPRGATWFHVWTGEAHEGGRTIEVDAPIGSPPVFSRDRDRPDLRAIE